MQEMSPEEVRERYSQIGFLGTLLEECPYASLKKMESHRYGALKAWPKLRSFKRLKRRERAGQPADSSGDEELTWDSIAWRPIASYSKHHWCSLISIAGRWMTWTAAELRWGWGVSDPRECLERTHRWNQQGGVAEPDVQRRYSSVFGDRRTARRRRGRGVPAAAEPQEEQRGDTTKILGFDVKDFFPSVSRQLIRAAVHAALKRTAELHPNAKYF